MFLEGISPNWSVVASLGWPLKMKSTFYIILVSKLICLQSRPPVDARSSIHDPLTTWRIPRFTQCILHHLIWSIRKPSNESMGCGVLQGLCNNYRFGIHSGWKNFKHIYLFSVLSLNALTMAFVVFRRRKCFVICTHLGCFWKTCFLQRFGLTALDVFDTQILKKQSHII